MTTYAARLNLTISRLSHRLTAGEVAEVVIDGIVEKLGAAAAIVGLFDESRDNFSLVRSIGYPAQVLAVWQAVRFDDIPAVQSIKRGVPVFIQSRASDSRVTRTVHNHFGEGAALFVPLLAAGRVIGGLSAAFTEVREFTDEERAFVLTLGAQCAQSLERARLFETEVSARQAAEAARRQLDAVLEQLPVAAVLVGADGAVQLNQEMHRFLGPGGDLAGLPLQRALAGEVLSGELLALPRSDGELRTMQVNAGPIRDPDGRIRSAVAVLFDVTEQDQDLAALRAAERRSAGVLHATNDVIWEWDFASDTLSWDGAVELLFGSRPEELQTPAGRGLSWWRESIHPDDLPRVRAISRAARKSSGGWSAEYRLRRADGSYVEVFHRCVYERNAAGEVVQVIGAVTDVSRRHRLLGELRQAVRVREDFLSIASHELQTPLAALSAQLQGLSLPTPGARDAKLDAAMRLTRRLTTLVDELLDVSRISGGKLRLEREPVDLAEMAREVTQRLAPVYARASTELIVEAEAAVPGLWDRLRVDLVLTNLLTNALRYGERRPVHLRVESAGEHARLVIRDSGSASAPRTTSGSSSALAARCRIEDSAVWA